MPEYTSKDKITEKDIILNYLQEIGKKFLVEFRGGYTEKRIIGNFIEEIYVKDSRKEAIQSIEFFSYLLLPKFDGAMEKMYTSIMGDIEKNLKDCGDKKISEEEYIVKKLKLMVKMFKELNQLLSRTGYLKKKAIIG